MIKKRAFIIGFIIFLNLIFLSNNIYASEIVTGTYSKKYEQWLALPEEERKNTIPPSPINIRNNEDNNIFTIFKSTLKAFQVPKRYDLREHINVEVKNQMDTGECWAFSANSSLETNLALKGENYNFSERHIDYATANNFIDGENEYALNRSVGDGGYSTTAFAYYSRGSGPILEETMPFENNEYPISINNLPKNPPVKKVDNMLLFPSVYKYKENGNLKYIDGNYIEYTQKDIDELRNKIKEHIMKYGSVFTDVYAPFDYYNSQTFSANMCEDNYSNHSVSIIGWDDNYSKDNFINKPSQDGAYIVLNSWGTDWGDNGVYYVSYEDFLIESNIRGVTSISNVEYDNLYQYDISEMWNSVYCSYAANVYTAKSNEKLTEVMVGSISEQVCDIYINATSDNLNINNLTKVASNVKLMPGYNTIKINSNVSISKGNKFAVVVKLTNLLHTGIGIEDNSLGPFSNAKSNPQESFISQDGINWTDIYNENNMMNLSIKAYTQSEEEKVEITNIKYPNKLLFENIGGEVNLELKTTKNYEDSILNVLVYDELNNDITSQFDINTNPIQNCQEKIKLNVPNTIKSGKYLVKIINNSTTIFETNLVVSPQAFDTSIYVKSKFTDENLYYALKNNILADTSIYAYFDNTHELILNKNITSLDFSHNMLDSDGNDKAYGYNIHNLDGIENLTNINFLNLSSNPIEDLKPLENLTKLEELYLKFNLENFNSNKKIQNMSVLGNLTKLDSLYITNLRLDDISFISSLNNLYNLTLTNCNIENIPDLSNLSNLHALYLNHNKIKDISPISNLKSFKNLVYIDLSFNKITNTNILDNNFYLKNMESINLCNQDLYIENIHKVNNIEVSEIIKQAMDKNSILYSEKGFTLINCEWDKYGKSIKLTPDSISDYTDSCSLIQIKSGIAQGTTLQVIYEDIIRIKKAPTKIEYKEGENFDSTGMIVEIVNEDGKYEETTEYSIIEGTSLIKGQEEVFIKSTKYPIFETFQSISVIDNPNLFLNSREYKITKNNTYIYSIPTHTSLNEFIENLNTNGNITVYKKDGSKLNGNELIGTGMILKSEKDGNKFELTISVLGDINGNSRIDTACLTKIRNCLYTNSELTQLDKLSIDTDKNGSITTKDLTLLRKLLYENI